MAAWWARLFGIRQKDHSLVFYAKNYLVVFEVGSQATKTQHAQRLYKAANEIAAEVGASDFLSLVKSKDIETIRTAAVRSAERFMQGVPDDDKYWSATYAVVNLMLLNYAGSLDDQPEARAVARNGAHLFAGALPPHTLNSS